MMAVEPFMSAVWTPNRSSATSSPNVWAAESIRRSVTNKLADGFYMTTALTLRPGEDILSA
mgnify:FL=1|jgi:hypothetical protein